MVYSNQALQPHMNPDIARTMAVTMKAAVQNLARGTILGQVTATGRYAVYNDALSDGTEVARGILMYDIQVASDGTITISSTSTQSGGDNYQTTLSIPMFTRGTFLCSELTGLDAAALVDLHGHLLFGTVANGAFIF
jgi:hypothetical protein